MPVITGASSSNNNEGEIAKIKEEKDVKEVGAGKLKKKKKKVGKKTAVKKAAAKNAGVVKSAAVVQKKVTKTEVIEISI